MPRPRLLVAAVLFALLSIAPSAGAETATVTSFDGTQLHVNFFPAAGLAAGQRAPTVMLGPGWSQPGDTNENGMTDPTDGIPGIGTLRTAGFNVVTWDPRGFGASGGQVEVDSPAYEGRDVSAIIDWLARQPQAQLDGANDPRVGMAGGSYGGGIQLVTAAADHRIDAIVPDIAWHSLVTSLDKNGTSKLGWASELYLLGKALGHLDPLIGESYMSALLGTPLTQAELSFYASRGPGSLVSKIRIPTLLVQGTVDNLFTLQEAVTNYEILRHDRVPVKMLWFCGGHGICITKPGDTGLITTDTIAWLDRYLKRDRHVRTGPAFEFVDQDGIEHTGSDYPLAAGTPLTASGSGTLAIAEAGGAGPVQAPSTVTSPTGVSVATLAGPIAPAKAPNAVNVMVPAPSADQLIAAAPQLSLTYQGTGTGETGDQTSIFAQVVDDTTGFVLGNQITPIPITLDGKTHTVTEPLEILAASDHAGEKLTLQLTASTVAYAIQHAVGTVTFSKIQLQVPTVAAGAKPPGYGAVAPNGCTDGGTIHLRLARGTRSARAMLGTRVLATGRRRLTIDLIGLGSRNIRVRVVTHTRRGVKKTSIRRYHACP